MMAGLGFVPQQQQWYECHSRCDGGLPTVLLGLAIWLCCDYLRLRGMGVDDEMLFTAAGMWYAPLNIHLAVE